MTTVNEEGEWKMLGKSKIELMYFSQIIVLYVVIITCILNLSLHNGDSNLWVALLSSSLGYMLPNPRLKKSKIQVNSTQNNGGGSTPSSMFVENSSHRMLPSEF